MAISRLRSAALQLAPLSTGLPAGFFYAFSSSVSPGLRELDDAGYIVLMGGLGVTFLANVPLNDEPAEVDPSSSRRLAAARAGYEDAWNLWNALRVVACTAALGCLRWAMRLPSVATHGRFVTRAVA